MKLDVVSDTKYIDREEGRGQRTANRQGGSLFIERPPQQPEDGVSGRVASVDFPASADYDDNDDDSIWGLDILVW